MKNAWKVFSAWFRANWKSNTIGTVVTVVFTAPEFVTSLHNWATNKPADWKMALFGVIMSTAFAVMKDYDTHSTAAEVKQSTSDETARQQASS